MGNLELLERAFSLAESGEVGNIDELRQALLGDGVSMSELEQFHGRALSRQLCKKIASSKRHGHGGHGQAKPDRGKSGGARANA